MPQFFTGLFLSILLGHLMIDVLNGQRAIMLAYLSVPMGLTNAVIGLITTIYAFVGALAQPVFGYIADRFGQRWVASLGLFWMCVFYALTTATSGVISLVFLVLASLGSGAFHPAGASRAAMIGKEHFSGKPTTVTAWFFLFGQAGFFFGPILGGGLLDRFGIAGIYGVAALGIPLAILLAWSLRGEQRPIKASEPASRVSRQSKVVKTSLAAILALAGVAFMQSWVQSNMTTFLPKYLSDLGQSATTYGLLTALFMGGSAIGNVIGGMISDRIGKRIVVVVSLILASVPLYLVNAAGVSIWLYVVITLSGFLTGATLSIIVVMAQGIIPNSIALAAGLAMGFAFSSGALGTLATGPLADAWGFAPVFQLTALISLIGGVCGLGLKEAPATT
jgi:FSR family fosmidomycin resistance protein-like MFS transporter